MTLLSYPIKRILKFPANATFTDYVINSLTREYYPEENIGNDVMHMRKRIKIIFPVYYDDKKNIETLI